MINKKFIERRYGNMQYRVYIPVENSKSKIGVLVTPTKKYGNKYGYELIDMYKHIIEPQSI